MAFAGASLHRSDSAPRSDNTDSAVPDDDMDDVDDVDDDVWP